MEQFNDTPIVNGVAYPKLTLQPKTYRLRMLNAANDRFFNFQWYTADPNQGDGTTEVALKPGELAAAQTDPTVSPTPVDAGNDAAGPDWVQIASEGGFLPAPAVIDGQQPTTWITDPTRFDVGNVDQHSLLLAPAERADVVVDFSKFAGKTLILYNDAPAAFPARVPQYDYYTGAPDLSPTGAPTIHAGYGPNTRTVMQVKIADAAPAAAFDLAKLQVGVQPQGRRQRGLRVRPAPGHRRPGGVQLRLRLLLRRQQQLQREGVHAAEVRRPGPRERHRNVRLQHAAVSGQQGLHADGAQGDPRRDEQLDVRRVRPDAGQPRRRGTATDTGWAERHALPVRQPADGADRRDEPAVR